MRTVLTAAGAAVALALPPAAVAQGGTGTTNPFNLGLPAPAAPTVSSPATTTAATTSTSGGNLSSGTVVGIAIGAIVVLGGISFFIWRDARRRAPVRRHTAVAPAGDGNRARQRDKPRKLSPAERRRRKRGRAR